MLETLHKTHLKGLGFLGNLFLAIDSEDVVAEAIFQLYESDHNLE